MKRGLIFTHQDGRDARTAIRTIGHEGRAGQMEMAMTNIRTCRFLSVFFCENMRFATAGAHFLDLKRGLKKMLFSELVL